jgi:hypothetical protein
MRSVLGGEELLNRFYYGAAGDNTSLNAVTLAETFFLTVVDKLLEILSQELAVTSVYAENLDDPTDFAELAVTSPGAIGERPGNYLSSFNAWGYTMGSTDRFIRTGGKRFGGVSEEDVDQGILDPNSPVYQTVIDFAGFLDTPMTDAFDPNGLWQPVLYSPGNTATGGLPWWAAVEPAQYVRLTTQNTRKPWG